MSSKNKLQKFEEMRSFSNVLQNYSYHFPALIDSNGQVVDYKGSWSKSFFKNANPITLELACGGGEYSLGLAQIFPKNNFIGIDIKGARIYRGASFALRNNLDNVGFIRTKIELIHYFIDQNEIDEIWITFPDPFLKESKKNRRLTSSFFLQKYQHILKPGGNLHLKTDDKTLYEFTLESISDSTQWKLDFQHDNIYDLPNLPPELQIKTFYEKLHLKSGKTIKYIKAIYTPQLNNDTLESKGENLLF